MSNGCSLNIENTDWPKNIMEVVRIFRNSTTTHGLGRIIGFNFVKFTEISYHHAEHDYSLILFPIREDTPIFSGKVPSVLDNFAFYFRTAKLAIRWLNRINILLISKGYSFNDHTAYNNFWSNLANPWGELPFIWRPMKI